MKSLILRRAEGIESSEVVLSLFTDNYKNCPEAVIDLGIAMLADKPIVLLVKRGTVLSENIKKVAKAIEYFETPDDISEAGRRLMKVAFDL